MTEIIAANMDMNIENLLVKYFRKIIATIILMGAIISGINFAVVYFTVNMQYYNIDTKEQPVDVRARATGIAKHFKER